MTEAEIQARLKAAAESMNGTEAPWAIVVFDQGRRTVFRAHNVETDQVPTFLRTCAQIMETTVALDFPGQAPGSPRN